MKLRELALGDVLIIDSKPYKRTEWFDCEDSAGDPYYRLEGENAFRKFSGHEQVTLFSGNVYILEEEQKG